MKINLIFLAFFAISSVFGQTQFWSDNFEDAGAPSSGIRTPSVQNFWPASAPYSRYFARVAQSDLNLQNGPYTGVEGAKIWAAEDIDAALTGTNFGQSSHQNITWTSINIAGKTGLTFRGLFAADNTGVNWEGSSIPPADYMIVEYRIDGGAWSNAVRFFSNSSINGQLALETTGDSLAEGALLTKAFTEYTGTITGTGTTLELRFKCSSNGATTEEFAIDNFRLFESPACTAPTITANPPNRAICAGNNTTFTSNASGVTAFQWQVNTGSGFTDIVNGGVYSNATTNILTITGATAGMSGNLYRCRAMNGVASCFTNTNQSTLTVSSVNTSSASQTNISCNGFANGAASVTPSGGIAPYSYSWSPAGGTGSIATGLSAGSYTVTVTDNIGCQGTRNYTITQPPVLNGSTVVTNVACFGGNTGAINLTPSGGTPGYTFNWSAGPTTEDRTSLTAGTYAVTITDANGCTRNVTGITVTQPTSAVSGTTVVTNVSCNSGTNGAINLTPTGGTGPYTYAWTAGPATEDRTGLAAGTYSVTITDVNGCTGTVSGITVTQPTAVSGSTVVTNVACFGGNTGAINLTPTGGTPGYTFNWAGGITTEDRTSLVSGTYSVTITDANGCTGTVSPTVTQPAASVSGTTVVTNVACFGGNTGAINLTPTGGTGPYTFNWLPSGPTTEDRISLVAGTYQVQITDANACTGTVSATVTQPAASVSGTTVVTNVACFGGNTGAINLTPTGGTGPYTFNWAGGITTEDRTSLVAGTYSVTITDANGCTGTVSPTLTQSTAISLTPSSQTNVACFGTTTGAAAVNPATGGSGGYTYNWTPGNPTGDGTISVTGLVATTWTCTVTDANSCTAAQNFTVTQPTALSLTAASQTNVSCNGGSNGATAVNASTGGAGGYTYNWTPGNPTGDGTVSITGLTAQNYTCTVTDANACTASVNFTVTQPSALSLTAASQTNVSCNGGSNGATAVNAATGGAGGYTYNWTPGNPTGDGTVSITGLTAQNYTCTVTDANACVASVIFTVTQPPALSLTAASQTNVACNGGSNGAAEVNPATGGAGGYTYDWTPGTPTGDGTISVNGLTAGTWTCNVTDINGCMASQTFTVTQPTALSLTAVSQTNVSCNGGSDGAVTVNAATGGTGAFTYDWTPGTPSGDGTISVNGLSVGTYICTATDNNGCTVSETFTVTQPTAISVTASSQTNVSCNGGSNGSAAINTPTGGAGSFTYDWTPGTPTGDGTVSITGLTAQTYTCTVTDANGCTASQSFTVTEPTAISVTASSQTNVSCNGGSNGSAAIDTPTGGAGSFTYDWTPGTPTGDGTVSITGLTAQTYTCTVTDANGCIASQSFTVTEPTELLATVNSQTNVSCNGGSDGDASVDLPTGGTAPYTYSWSPSGGTGATASGLAAGTYTNTITDDNGCTTTATVTITEPSVLSAVISDQVNTACNGEANGSATVTSTGGTAPYEYVWSPTGGTNETASGLAAGTYTTTITDDNGCTTTATVTITEPSAITATIAVTECDSATVNGITYYTTDLYEQVLVSSATGCDSTLTIDVTIELTPLGVASLLNDTTVQTLEVGDYQWVNCATGLDIPNATGAIFEPTNNGSYAVNITNGNCSILSNCVTVNGFSTIGISEKEEIQFSFAPNPAHTSITLFMSATMTAQMNIMDAQGKIVITNPSVTNGTQVSLDHLERGVYFLQLQSEKGSALKRVVKQ